MDTFLEKLQVSFVISPPNIGDISPNEPLELAQGLQHLENMQILGDNARALGLGTGHIGKIFEALPNLKVLVLEFQCALMEATLIEVGKHCGRT